MHSLQISAFVILALLLVGGCWRNVKHRDSHGFYRLFAFVSLAALLSINGPHWFIHPRSTPQLASWLLLCVSLVLVLMGLLELRRLKKRTSVHTHPANFSFENTAELTQKGIYRYIRHPMYLSLIFLCWGIWLKHTSMAGLLLAISHTLLMWKTATVEEGENLQYFGDSYRQYIAKTHRFIPRIL